MNSFVINYNGLDDAQLERLAILSEEAGEIVQCVSKIMRHGYENCHPRDEAKKTNRRHLEEEIGNLMHMVDRLIKAEDLRENMIVESEREKAATIGKYLHHQNEPQAILSGPRESLL